MGVKFWKIKELGAGVVVLILKGILAEKVTLFLLCKIIIHFGVTVWRKVFGPLRQILAHLFEICLRNTYDLSTMSTPHFRFMIYEMTLALESAFTLSFFGALMIFVSKTVFFESNPLFGASISGRRIFVHTVGHVFVVLWRLVMGKTRHWRTIFVVQFGHRRLSCLKTVYIFCEHGSWFGFTTLMLSIQFKISVYLI